MDSAHISACLILGGFSHLLSLATTLLFSSIYNFANPSAAAPNTVTYATYEQSFQQIGNLAEKERLALFVGECTYGLEVDPGIAGELQNLWDQLLSKRIFCCASPVPISG